MMTTKISRPGAPGGERAQDEPMMDFTQSFDARDWARAFVDMVRVKPSIATDEGTMLGWFANALMRGWDEHAKRAASPERERALCPTCGGNGVVKIPGGVSVCDACNGDCWAKPEDWRGR